LSFRLPFVLCSHGEHSSVVWSLSSFGDLASHVGIGRFVGNVRRASKRLTLGSYSLQAMFVGPPSVSRWDRTVCRQCSSGLQASHVGIRRFAGNVRWASKRLTLGSYGLQAMFVGSPSDCRGRSVHQGGLLHDWPGRWCGKHEQQSNDMGGRRESKHPEEQAGAVMHAAHGHHFRECGHKIRAEPVCCCIDVLWDIWDCPVLSSSKWTKYIASNCSLMAVSLCL
jgi:hypothetical protein